MLLRPMHPIHFDIAFMAGWKVVVIVLWLPMAFVLSLLFHPTFNADLANVVVFFVAIWGAYLIRSLELWSLGMVTFWTTRVGPVFDVVLHRGAAPVRAARPALADAGLGAAARELTCRSSGRSASRSRP